MSLDKKQIREWISYYCGGTYENQDIVADLIIKRIPKEAIKFTDSSLQLKEKYTPHFGEWVEAEGYDYVKNSLYKKGNTTFNKLELVRRYNEYLQSL